MGRATDHARYIRRLDPDVKGARYTLLNLAASFGDYDTGADIRPSQELLAELTGLHVDTVQDAMLWLVNRGHLFHVGGRGHRNSVKCYRLNLKWTPESPASDRAIGSESPASDPGKPGVRPGHHTDQGAARRTGGASRTPKADDDGHVRVGVVAVDGRRWRLSCGHVLENMRPDQSVVGQRAVCLACRHQLDS